MRFALAIYRFCERKSLKPAQQCQATISSLVKGDPGKYLTESGPESPSPYGIYDGGAAIHESGTVRMGNNPKTSALNEFNESHDVKNLFVTDAAAFVTSPDKNPTLTILALSWRASEFLLQEAKQGNL